MEFTLTEEPTRLVAVVRRSVPMDQLPAFYDSAYRAVAAAVASSDGTTTGPAFGWYVGVPTESADVAAGFPVSGLAAGPAGSTEDGVEVVEQPGGRAVSALYVGPYDGLPAAWQELESWRAAHAYPGRGDFWEEYISDPSPEGDPTKNETRLVLPLR